MTFTVFAVIAASVVCCGGCGGANPTTGSASATDAPATTDEKPPAERTIASLVPSVTETLFAMGLGDRVVGRSRYASYPPEVMKLPVVGDAINVNLERLLVVRPDIVVFHTRAQDANRITSAGIRIIAPRIETVDEVYSVARELGRELGAESAAEALVSRLEGELKEVRGAAAGAEPVKTLITFPVALGGGAELRVVGRKTFVDELLTLAGGANVCPTEGYPRVSIETVVRWQPQVIIISAPGDIAPGRTDEQYRAAWDSWKSIPAVRDGRVAVLREAYLTLPGPRMGQAARLLLTSLHPDLAAAGESASASSAEAAPLPSSSAATTPEEARP